ncbi:WD repeat domain phosphoinositide-interacting protein 1-like [Physeter macrocephalus]|uniref:WD repeat domain phosphoinositide-interacting protein 1-like n=1 Tax=Physeter macrocephalus TaxID=9755 RepID=A0A9W2X329_PHYMC|nr:WD repeat domain phosphoinositide-interacting protein 1-like [Physeter catodon]
MEAGAANGPSGGVEEALSCFSFNQDCTSLAIGTKSGYKLFSLSSVEQLGHVHGSNDIPDVCIVERLFSSSLVVVVSHAKPRQMNVYHFKKGTEICSYSYSSNVLSIRLNRQVRGWGLPPGRKAPAAGDQGERGASLGVVRRPAG